MMCEERPRPHTYNQRTGHKVKSEKHILQHEVDSFYDFTQRNKFRVNESKCEVLVFNFSRKCTFPPEIHIGQSDIVKETTHSRILGLTIQSNLKWDKHILEMYNKAISKLWTLRRLRRYHFNHQQLTDFYVKEIRSILEYAVPVWFSAITVEQSKLIEKIQRYSVSIILNDYSWSYEVQCTLLSIEPLFLRRRQIALSFAKRTANNPNHAEFFKKKVSKQNTRSNSKFYQEEITHSDRFYKSPLVALTRELNKNIKNKLN